MVRIPRKLTHILKKAAQHFPALVVTGPRRAGKTTLFRHTFPKAKYILLEDPDIQARVRSDPRAFLEALTPPVIFDEIQNIPIGRRIGVNLPKSNRRGVCVRQGPMGRMRDCRVMCGGVRGWLPRSCIVLWSA